MFGVVDRWIDRAEGFRRVGLTQDESLEIIASNLLSAFGSDRKIGTVLLTSSIPDADFSNLCNKLSEKFPSEYSLKWVKNPRLYPESAKLMADCSGIVLLEREGKSKHSALACLVEYINDYNKEIYGFVMV